MKGFLNASLCLAGMLTCDFYSREMRPGAAAVPKMRKLQECIEFSLPVNEFLKPQGHEASEFPLFFPYCSKLDATFVQSLALSIGILPGIASVATKMDLVQGIATAEQKPALEHVARSSTGGSVSSSVSIPGCR